MILAPDFEDRAEAGVRLAKALEKYKKKSETIVLALPRGGVPVAREIAPRLGLPLDLCLVRKLGVPGHEELALGALAMGQEPFLNADVIKEVSLPQERLQAIVEKEDAELARRNKAYRGDRPPPEVEGKTVILVDDGAATGADMRAAIKAVRHQKAVRVVVALPVAPHETIDLLRREADDVVCLSSPEFFFAVGQAYRNFDQLEDEEVIELMAT